MILFTIVPIFIVIVACLVFGGSLFTFYSAFRNRNRIQQFTEQALDAAQQQHRRSSPRQQERSEMKDDGNYSCDHCGAGLASNTEISPSGDFKCPYCDRWSNVN